MRPPRIHEDQGVRVIKLDDATALNDGNPLGLRQALFRLLADEPGPRFAADLGSVEFLSSSGVALLLGLKRRIEEKGGRLVLLATRPTVIDQFRVMKLANFFSFAPDLSASLELFPPVPPV